MNPSPQLVQLRTKKIGVLMEDARLAGQKKAEDCALAMGVSVRRYRNYELGKAAPSLPELEALAYYLDVPIHHFWGKNSLSEKEEKTPQLDGATFIELRQRIIGLKLREVREGKEISQVVLSESSSVPENRLRRYEAGQLPIPIPELEQICNSLDLPMETLYAEHGPIGEWHYQKEMVQRFLALSPNIQKFVCLPVNQPYLDLAMRLSALSVEKLRTVAEGLLEITY